MKLPQEDTILLALIPPSPQTKKRECLSDDFMYKVIWIPKTRQVICDCKRAIMGVVKDGKRSYECKHKLRFKGIEDIL